MPLEQKHSPLSISTSLLLQCRTFHRHLLVRPIPPPFHFFNDTHVIPHVSAHVLRGLLLRWGATNVLANISGIMKRPGATLDTIPDLSRRWWNTLSTNQAVNSSFQLPELTLDEAALGESCAEEGSVDSDQDPGALSEGESGEEETEPETDFKNGHETHGGVIVFFDELADHIGGWVCLVCWLGAWGSTCSWCNRLRGLNSGDEVCAGVSCDVED